MLVYAIWLTGLVLAISRTRASYTTASRIRASSLLEYETRIYFPLYEPRKRGVARIRPVYEPRRFTVWKLSPVQIAFCLGRKERKTYPFG